ncbi:MAG: hypothetical protein KC910_05085 [Candidatus Eremiobacteraeota bacterium]|nr:hypothetical protein [Candidatus Eremiobacteraeota bacterium]
MAVISRLLSSLVRPKSTEQLAQELATDKATLEPLLALLEARGYVGQAYDDSPACGTGCGSCSMRTLCPAQGSEAPFLPVWRATHKGLAAMNLQQKV